MSPTTISIDQFDLKQTGAYLEAHLDGFKGLNKAEKFSDGQSNPTFLLSADSGRYVLSPHMRWTANTGS